MQEATQAEAVWAVMPVVGGSVASVDVSALAALVRAPAPASASARSLPYMATETAPVQRASCLCVVLSICASSPVTSAACRPKRTGSCLCSRVFL